MTGDCVIICFLSKFLSKEPVYLGFKVDCKYFTDFGFEMAFNVWVFTKIAKVVHIKPEVYEFGVRSELSFEDAWIAPGIFQSNFLKCDFHGIEPMF